MYTCNTITTLPTTILARADSNTAPQQAGVQVRKSRGPSSVQPVAQDQPLQVGVDEHSVTTKVLPPEDSEGRRLPIHPGIQL